jgi:hypothetical protein
LVAFQAISNAIDVESDVDSYDTDDADDFQSMEFVKYLIVTPRVTRGKVEVGSAVLTTVKRNLSKVFDKIAKSQKVSL